jgi:hypothetical protein
VLLSKSVVRIAVDRSRWYLDIAPMLGREPIQFDLLVSAHRGKDYAECFPHWSRAVGSELPTQLPPGIIWRETLPDVLDWISGTYDVETAAARANRQRYAQMWPD